MILLTSINRIDVLTYSIVLVQLICHVFPVYYLLVFTLLITTKYDLTINCRFHNITAHLSKGWAVHYQLEFHTSAISQNLKLELHSKVCCAELWDYNVSLVLYYMDMTAVDIDPAYRVSLYPHFLRSLTMYHFTQHLNTRRIAHVSPEVHSACCSVRVFRNVRSTPFADIKSLRGDLRAARKTRLLRSQSTDAKCEGTV